MSINGSYDITNFAIDMPREILRLNAQLDLFWHQEHSLYQRFGLVDGMSVLDCGCGPAYLLEKLHELYPSLQCTGIEIADPMIAAAIKNIADKKLDRCKVYQQSITAMDLPDNSFDFVIVRIVLEHLPDPSIAFREVLRVLKNGGRAVFVDNDFDYHPRTHPPVLELTDLYKAYCEAREKDGGNPRIGRQLPILLSNAGFDEITFDVVCAHNALTGDNAFSQSEGSGIAIQLVHNGFLNTNDYDQLAVNWSTMLKHPDHSIIRQLFVGSGLRSQESISALYDGAVYREPLPDQTATTTGSCKLSDHLIENTLVEGLISAVAEALEISPETITSNRNLGDLGIDSVASVMLSSRIENELHVTIPSMDFFTEHSVDDIASFISNSLKNVTPVAVNNNDDRDSEFEEGEL